MIERTEKLDVKGKYDVVVIGGGIAGVSAALSAARENLSVCLIEREYALGGLATLGIVAVYLPLCDGNGTQLIGGIAEELLKESIKYGSGKIPNCWLPNGKKEERRHQRYKLRFDPTSFMYALDKLVNKEGIHVMFGTSFSGVIKQKNTIKYLILENKEGRFAIEADVVIDASGDAAVCNAAGEDVEVFNKNKWAAWYYSYADDEYKLNINQQPLQSGDDGSSIGGINADEITNYCFAMREKVMEHRLINNPNSIITQIPTIPQIRMSRRLKGKFELKEDDENNKFVDSVGCFGDWKKAGPRFYLPYSILFGKCKNLLVAGRCISADEKAGDVTRAIPVCALSGEVCGKAAGIKINNNLKSVQEVDAEKLREKMIQNNNILK